MLDCSLTQLQISEVNESEYINCVCMSAAVEEKKELIRQMPRSDRSYIWVCT